MARGQLSRARPAVMVPISASRRSYSLLPTSCARTSSGRNGCGDLGEVQVHRLGVAGWHDQGCTLALLRADCTEDVGGSGPLVPRCAWTGAALGPATGDLVLLADAGLVGEPDFYRVAVKRLLARNCLQA